MGRCVADRPMWQLVALLACGLLFGKNSGCSALIEEYAAAPGLACVWTGSGIDGAGVHSGGHRPAKRGLAAGGRPVDRSGRGGPVLDGPPGAMAPWAGVVGLPRMPWRMASDPDSRLAGGPIIVLAGASLFLVSMLFGARRGYVHRLGSCGGRLQQSVQGVLDLLRAMFTNVWNRT